MRRFLCTLFVCAIVAGPAQAMLTLEFSPGSTGGASAGGWSFDGATTLTFSQAIQVDLVGGAGLDALVTSLARVEVPTMTVSGIPGGPYMLDGGPVSITDALGTTIYMTGTLGIGDLVPVGTTAAEYTTYTADITAVTVTPAGLALGSDFLNYVDSVPAAQRELDFELSMQGGPPAGFKHMLDSGMNGGDGFSGAMTIPEPATLLLLGLGGVCLVRRRRKG